MGGNPSSIRISIHLLFLFVLYCFTIFSILILFFFFFILVFVCVLQDFGDDYMIGRVHLDKADDLLDHPWDSSVLTFNISYIETMHVLSLGELSFFF